MIDRWIQCSVLVLVLIAALIWPGSADAVLATGEKAVIADLEVSVSDAATVLRASTVAQDVSVLTSASYKLSQAMHFFLGHHFGGSAQPARVATAYAQIDAAIVDLNRVAGTGAIVTRLQAIDRTLTFSAWRGTWYPNVFNQTTPPRPIGRWDTARDNSFGAASYAQLACSEALKITNTLAACYELSRAWQTMTTVARIVLAEADGAPTVTAILVNLRLLLVDVSGHLSDGLTALEDAGQFSGTATLGPAQAVAIGWEGLDRFAWELQTHVDIFGSGT